MKIARIELEACEDCPHVVWTYPPECMAIPATPREIQDTAEIPDWCPLPDAPEAPCR